MLSFFFSMFDWLPSPFNVLCTFVVAAAIVLPIIRGLLKLVGVIK